MDRKDLTDGGITNADCDKNPSFCNYNTVYVKYCDGNSFSGARSDTVRVDDKELHFKGFFILEAVLTDLFANEGLDEATDVLVTGCSAGGLSAILHSDYIGSWFTDTVRYGVVPVSGMFQMQRSNVYGEPVMPLQMQTIFTLSNATSGVHQGCIDDLGNSWLCNIAPTVYNYIESPIFVLDSSIDLWQNGCIYTATTVDQDVPTEDVPNGKCATASNYEACGRNPADCSPEQMYSIIEYQSNFIESLTNAYTYKKSTNGVFIYECSTHCSGSSDDYYNIGVAGVKMNKAVNRWWQSLEPSSDSDSAGWWDWGITLEADNTDMYLPMLWRLDGTNPNTSC